MRKHLRWILIVVAIGVACLAAAWPALRFAKIEVSDLPSRLAMLFLCALLIERTVEVLLTIWRAEDANKKQTEVQRLLDAGKGALDPAVKSAQDALLKYRAETLRLALPLSFFLGLLIAGLGVRFMDQFIDEMLSQPDPTQLWWFHVADIVLTASLLAGGADPIHKVLDAFRKFMEASANKASGTTK